MHNTKYCKSVWLITRKGGKCNLLSLREDSRILRHRVYRVKWALYPGQRVDSRILNTGILVRG